jgi:hypothetical protein
MKSRSAEDERRSGTHWLDIAVFDLAAMAAMWWLVGRTTNGENDADLLPLLALIPLLIGLLHAVHSRLVRTRRARRAPSTPSQLPTRTDPRSSGSAPR